MEPVHLLQNQKNILTIVSKELKSNAGKRELSQQ